MPIFVECPRCHRKASAPDDAAGKVARCPSCRTPISIPSAAYALREPEVARESDEEIRSIGGFSVSVRKVPPDVPWKPRSIKTIVVGVRHRQAAIRRVAMISTTAYLISEPENDHDPNAIAVYVENEQIGYLPADVAEQVSRLPAEWTYGVSRFEWKPGEKKNELWADIWLQPERTQ